MLQVDAHAEECFFDKVKQGTKMSLMFEVAEGGFLDIDVRIEGKNLATPSLDTKNVNITVRRRHLAVKRDGETQ